MPANPFLTIGPGVTAWRCSICGDRWRESDRHRHGTAQSSAI